MNRTSQRNNFSSRRVQNLTAVASVLSASDVIPPSQGERSPPAPGPNPTFEDSDEDDLELKALRQAALASRKPEKRPSANGRGPAPSSRTHLAPPPPTTMPLPLPLPVKVSSPLTTGRNGKMTSNTSRQLHTKTSSRPSKYEDLDLEGLRQVYRASKRSRRDRRNNSDDSSSEDDDFEYVKSSRPQGNSDNSPRPHFERNGYNSSLSPPPVDAGAPLSTDYHHDSPSPVRFNSGNLTSIIPTNVDHPQHHQEEEKNRTLGGSSEQADAAMERRRQKFQSTGVVSEEKTKVSLASLKSNSIIPTSPPRHPHQEDESESMHSECLWWSSDNSHFIRQWKEGDGQSAKTLL